VVADYAYQHPDSVAACCLRTACMVGTDAATVARVGAEAASTAPKTGAAEESSGETAEAGTAAETVPPQQPEEVIDLTPAISPETAPETETVIVDTEDLPPQMPACEGEESVPATMPPADGEACEKCAAPESQGDEPGSFWDCLFPRKYELLPMPAADPEPGSAEDSEAIHEGKPSDCRMDPGYSKEYPGCPYMGGNPDHQCPTAEPKPHKKKKVKAEPKPEAPAGETMIVPKNLQPLPPYDVDTPPHPEVDTMEFRKKDDAKKGEFAPHPF
jgi:hypothetical protein